MNFPNEAGGFNPMMNPGMGMMQGNPMMNPGMGMMQGNPIMNLGMGMIQQQAMMNLKIGMMQQQVMMNHFLIQQQQAKMNNFLRQQQFGQLNQPNMLNQANVQQQVIQNMMQKQQLINNNINTPNPPNSNYITIFFKLQRLNGPDLDPYNIQCSLDDKVSTIIQKFRIKAKDFDVLHEKFIFNGKKLNETLTAAESGLANTAVVFVINDRDLEGAF